MNPGNTGKAFVWTCAGLVLGAALAGCADIKLLKYRDDQLLAQHRYALGEQYLDVGGLRLCYQEQGQGQTVLILPGLGTDIDFWQLNLPALAERYRVVAVDLPGLGKSDKPDADYDLPWICARIIDFLDAKQLDRVSIIGGSLGGHLGLLIALDYPQRVDKLVMMGATGGWPPVGPLLDLGIRLLWNEWVVIEYVRTHWSDVYELMFIRETELTRGLFRYQMAVRANGQRFWPEGRALSRALRSIFYNSCRDRLTEVPVPVLLIWGESDRIHPPENGLFLRRRIPDSRIVIVPDAGHEVMIDQPQVFNRTVRAFLQAGTDAIEDSVGALQAADPARAKRP